MEYEPLTSERIEAILAKHGITILRRIRISPLFVAELVSEGVLESYDSQDVLALETPSQQRNALLERLQTGSVEAFISFCIIMEEKEGRRDIVHEEFGLELRHLKHQRDVIRGVDRPGDGTGRARSAGEASRWFFPDGSGSANSTNKAKQPAYSSRQKHDKPSAASRVPPTPQSPPVPPSPAFIPEDIESLRGDMESIQIKECKMLHDPIEERLLTHLDPVWNAAVLVSLRRTLHGKYRKPVVIALLDSGIRTDHPDFTSISLITENRNCVGKFTKKGRFTPDELQNKDLTQDKANHGTVSAGIVWQCATEENIKILNLKVINDEGNGSFWYVGEALRYIKQWDAEHPHTPVDIVLMTHGAAQADANTNKLLSELGEHKILVCSASNEGQQKANSVLCPANNGSVIAIGSCDRLGNRCSHSSVGQELDFLFPGEKIQSTSSKLNCHYIEKSGTSFAAPYAAAVMALVLCYVETHITNLAGQNGAYWRKVLTKSAEMKCLLRDVCCRREHSHEKGFGVPELERIRVDGILAYLKLKFHIPDY